MISRLAPVSSLTFALTLAPAAAAVAGEWHLLQPGPTTHDSLPHTGFYFSSNDGRAMLGYTRVDGASRPARWTPAGGIETFALPAGAVVAEVASGTGSRYFGASSDTFGENQRIQLVEWNDALEVVRTFDLGEGIARGAPISASATGDKVLLTALGPYDDFDSHTPHLWTSAGIQSLGPRPAGMERSNAWSLSGDGSTAVGWFGQGSWDGDKHVPFRWTASAGYEVLDQRGFLNSDEITYAARARLVSDDGSVIAGAHTPDFGFYDHAVIWDDDAILRRLDSGRLGWENDTLWEFSRAEGMSADGSLIVGSGVHDDVSTGFIWTDDGGMEPFRDVLTRAGIDLSIWESVRPSGISRDGRIVNGTLWRRTDGGSETAYFSYRTPTPGTLVTLVPALLACRPRRRLAPALVIIAGAAGPASSAPLSATSPADWHVLPTSTYRLNGLPALQLYWASQDARTLLGELRTETGMLPMRWSPARGLHPLDLPAGMLSGEVTATSADASRLFGMAYDGDEFIDRTTLVEWNADGHIVQRRVLPDGWKQGRAFDASASGDAVLLVRTGPEGDTNDALRPAIWNPSDPSLGGLTLLDPLPAGMSDPVGLQLSDDGRTASGYFRNGQGWSDDNAAFRWNAQSGYEILDRLGPLPTDPLGTDAIAMSADGSTIAGTAWSQFSFEPHAVIWDAFGTMRRLDGGRLGWDYETLWELSQATAMSSDGNTIIGAGTYDGDETGFVWTNDGGMQPFGDVLRAAGIDVSQWDFVTPTSISRDGLIVNGDLFRRVDGNEFEYSNFSFRVPTPATFVLLLPGLVATNRRRGR